MFVLGGRERPLALPSSGRRRRRRARGAPLAPPSQKKPKAIEPPPALSPPDLNIAEGDVSLCAATVTCAAATVTDPLLFWSCHPRRPRSAGQPPRRVYRLRRLVLASPRVRKPRRAHSASRPLQTPAIRRAERCRRGRSRVPLSPPRIGPSPPLREGWTGGGGGWCPLSSSCLSLRAFSLRAPSVRARHTIARFGR